MKDIAIFGAGGLGRELACLINRINEHQATWNLIGFFDDGVNKGASNEYGTILGGMEELNNWATSLSVVIAVGSPNAIYSIINKINNPNIEFPNIVAPNVTFLDKQAVSIGKGNVICSNCLLSCNVSIGDFNIFNGYVPIGHDTAIGNYNVFMPSVNISGGVTIGDCNFFGVQSVVLQYIKIGNNVRVGANSVMMRHGKDGFLYMGNPAMKTQF